MPKKKLAQSVTPSSVNQIAEATPSLDPSALLNAILATGIEVCELVDTLTAAGLGVRQSLDLIAAVDERLANDAWLAWGRDFYEDKIVKGDLDLSGCLWLKALPSGLTVLGDFNVSGCTGIAIPGYSYGLKVKGSFIAVGCTWAREIVPLDGCEFGRFIF